MKKQFNRVAGGLLAVLGWLASATAPAVGAAAAGSASPAASWEPSGWGGGGFYYATVFHPAQDGVIYLAGDVGGVYKTEDHGRHWKFINNGLVDYGVFSLAVDRVQPQTVYAATEGGLCKSTDGGEHWQLLPRTERKELRITGEKGRSIRSVAVDPTDGNIVYAASPAGKVFKSTDGGQTWKAVYEPNLEQEAPDTLRVQFGKVNGDYFGGMWSPLAFPAGVKSEECVGFGFAFKGDGTRPQDAYLSLKTSSGVSYRSKNLNDLFKDTQWRDVLLKAEDFIVDPEYAKKNPEAVKTLPAGPNWATVNRMDFALSGPLPNTSAVGKLGRFFFAVTRTADGQTAPADKPILVTVKDFSTSKAVQSYGNIRIGNLASGSVYSVAVAAKQPSLVLAATNEAGLVLSEDGGQTWSELNTPKKAACATFDPADPNVIYGAFFTDGIQKSTDKGKTWTKLSAGLAKDFSVKEVVVSPANSLDVYAIGAVGWGGGFYRSNDGGGTWKSSSTLAADFEANPTLPGEGANPGLSNPTNLAVNPLNPKELYISANWRCCLSEDGGLTWTERDRGADISCVTDIRFSGGRTYVSVMDEGVLASENNGKSWRPLWPLKWDPTISGHFWRLAITANDGVDRIVSTSSPWDQYPNGVVLSEDGGKSFKRSVSGLPDYIPTANTMWGRGYARALAVDPQDPKIIYVGIDGDPSGGKNGGGIFKSEDGGATWKQLANQPGSRRMYFGLAVDPTDSRRIFWGSCGAKGGVYRSADSGATWQNVFAKDEWIFNVMVSPAGVVYCSGKNLWRSTDHGATWKQLTNLTNNWTVVGIEVDPRDAKTIWISATTWDGSSQGAVYKSTDDGATWQDITGNLPYRKPQILRFNPATNELWAGFVGLYKIKQ